MPIIMTQPIPEAPSVGEQLFTALLGGINKYQKGKTDRRIREAIKRALGEEPEKQTPVGRFLSTLFEPPLTEAEEKLYPEILKEKIKGKEIWSKSGLTNLARNKILGILQTGFYVHPLTNQNLPIKTREQAIDFIRQSGYLNYEEDPEIMQVINQFPSKNQAKQNSPKKGLFLSGNNTSSPKKISVWDKIFRRGESLIQRLKELEQEGKTKEEAFEQLFQEGY